MQLLKEKLKNRHFKKETKKTSEWQEIGTELTKFFGTNCYWLLWKYPIQKIYEKFKEIKKLEKTKQTLNYFIGCLHK